MKIVVISHSAVVALYREKYHYMAAQGIEVHLILPKRWPEGHRKVLAPAAGREKGIVIHTLTGGFFGRVGGYYLRGLKKIIHTLKPDLVHLEEEPYSLVGLQVLTAVNNVKCKWVFFSLENIYRLYRWPLSWIDRKVLKNCPWAIVASEEACKVLRQRHYQGEITVIPQYGIDPDYFIKSKDTSVENRTYFKIGYAGRLLKEKGIETLLLALKGLDQDWQLIIIGNGPFRSNLQDLINTLDLNKRVLVEDSVDYQDMPKVLRQLDILVLPSLTTLTWKEQFGRILIEAMACEVAVVGSSSGEIPHVIGDAGVIFPEKDHLALKESIEQLIENPDLRIKLGQLGRQRVLEHFTTDQIVERTMLVYQKMIANSGV